MRHFLLFISLSCLLLPSLELHSTSVFSKAPEALENLWASTTYALQRSEGRMDPEMIQLYSSALSCSLLLGSSQSDSRWLRHVTPIKTVYMPSDAKLSCDKMALEILASYGTQESYQHLMRHARSSYSPFSLYTLSLLSQCHLNTYTRELLDLIIALKRRYPKQLTASTMALVMRFPKAWSEPYLTKWFYEGNFTDRATFLYYLPNAPHLDFERVESWLSEQSHLNHVTTNALLLRLVALQPEFLNYMPSFLMSLVDSTNVPLKQRALSVLYGKTLDREDGQQWNNSLSLTSAEDFSSILLFSDQFAGKLPPELQERLNLLLESSAPELRLNAALVLASTGSENAMQYLLDQMDVPKKFIWKYSGTLPHWQIPQSHNHLVANTEDNLLFHQLLTVYMQRIHTIPKTLIDKISLLAIDTDVTHSLLGIKLTNALPRKEKMELFQSWVKQPGRAFLRITSLTQCLDLEPNTTHLERLKEDLLYYTPPPLNLPTLSMGSADTSKEFAHTGQQRLHVQNEWQVLKKALEIIKEQDQAPRRFLKTLYEKTTRSDLRLFLSKMHYEQLFRP